MSKENFPGVPFWILFVTLIALSLICHHEINTYKQQAIERGFAEYDQATGEWQWRDDGK